MRRGLPHTGAILLALLGGASVAGACSPFDSSDEDSADNDATVDAGAVNDDPGGLNTTGVGAGTGAETGLPCDVQQLLENRCIGCHLATSRLPLLSYDDLMAPSKSDPKKSMADLALARMQNASNPMPPAPAAPPAPEEIDVLEKWLGRNAPRGTTCTPPPPADAGAPDTTNYNTPLVCTSKTMWTGSTGKGGKGGFGGFGGFGVFGGDDDEDERRNGSPLMDPGQACMACHNVRGGPTYKIAGTVYPTAHEPDDCNGVNGGLEVVITDADGAVRTLRVNEAGNFFDNAKLPAPFRVKIKRGGVERAMVSPVTAGDCNSCHTAGGVNGAPGRVMAP